MNIGCWFIAGSIECNCLKSRVEWLCFSELLQESETNKHEILTVQLLFCFLTCMMLELEDCIALSSVRLIMGLKLREGCNFKGRVQFPASCLVLNQLSLLLPVPIPLKMHATGCQKKLVGLHSEDWPLISPDFPLCSHRAGDEIASNATLSNTSPPVENQITDF